jgi:hypothetical protein
MKIMTALRDPWRNMALAAKKRQPLIICASTVIVSVKEEL